MDQSTDEGEQAWSQIKSNTAIELLEVSFTSTPIHPSARVLSWKSMAGPDCDSMNTEAPREHSLGVVAGINAKSWQPKIVSFACEAATLPLQRVLELLIGRDKRPGSLANWRSVYLLPPAVFHIAPGALLCVLER